MPKSTDCHRLQKLFAVDEGLMAQVISGIDSARFHGFVRQLRSNNPSGGMRPAQRLIGYFRLGSGSVSTCLPMLEGATSSGVLMSPAVWVLNNASVFVRLEFLLRRVFLKDFRDWSRDAMIRVRAPIPRPCRSLSRLNRGMRYRRACYRKRRGFRERPASTKAEKTVAAQVSSLF